MEIENLFLHEKPAGIILSLKKAREEKARIYASVLAKENDCTYTHVLKILAELEIFGLVKCKKEGRVKEVKLTDPGYDLALDLASLVEKLEVLPLIRVKGVGKRRAKMLLEAGVRTPEDLKNADVNLLIPIFGEKLAEKIKGEV